MLDYAEHAIGVSVSDDLDEAVGIAVRLGAAIGHHREFADLHLGLVAAGFLGFFALVGGIAIVMSLADGIAVPASAAIAVAALVLGAVGCVILHRLGARKLSQILSAVRNQE